MTDLEVITQTPAPRPARLVKRFAHRIDPLWGFVLYGILYFVVVANTVGVLPLAVLVNVYPHGEAAGWLPYAWLAWYLVVQVPVWWWFVAWKARRCAGAIALVRDGELVTASVSRPVGMGSSRMETIAFRGYELSPPIDFGDAQQCKVLFLAGARYVFVFAPDGSAMACGIHGDVPVGPLRTGSNTEPLPEARIVE